ncbi:MAG TPA: hypothetical protein VIL92_06290 [Gaiellaceae bacterium]
MLGVAEEFGMHIEAVMAMPFCRFMALQNVRSRRAIEERNASAREQWRKDIEGSQ